MYIKIYCTDLAEAILYLQNEIDDGELQGEIDKTDPDECETIYTPWGEIET